MQQLHNVMPKDNSNGPIYSLYGDLAYPQSSYLLGGFQNVINGMDEANFNRLMSSVCITVEWGYCEIIEQWKFLDFCQAMRIFQSPVVQYDINAAFLSNLCNCMIGNKTRNYFDAHQRTIEEYLALVTQVQPNKIYIYMKRIHYLESSFCNLPVILVKNSITFMFACVEAVI